MARSSKKEEIPENENLTAEPAAGQENGNEEIPETAVEESAEEEAYAPATDEDIIIPDTGEEDDDEKSEDALEEDAGKDLEEENGKADSPEERTRSRKSSIEVITAGKRKKKKLYNSDAVYTQNGLEKQNIKNSEQFKEFLDLQASAESANIKRGKIVGIKMINDVEVAAAISYGKYFNVSIPAEMLCDFSLEPPEVRKKIEQGGETKVKALRSIVNNMLGAEVDFRVKVVNEATKTAIGDHIEAMNRSARYHYATPQSDGRPRIIPGMLVEAQVMKVNRIGMWVEAFGAQAFIRSNEIDWIRRADFSERYAPGNKVTIKVLKISSKKLTYYKRGDQELTRGIVELEASVKQCTKNPNEEFFDMFHVGNTGLAEVVQVVSEGIFAVFMDRISIRCNFPQTGNNPEVGDIINVRISHKEENGHLFYGLMNNIVKSGQK